SVSERGSWAAGGRPAVSRHPSGHRHKGTRSEKFRPVGRGDPTKVGNLGNLDPVRTTGPTFSDTLREDSHERRHVARPGPGRPAGPGPGPVRRPEGPVRPDP